MLTAFYSTSPHFKEECPVCQTLMSPLRDDNSIIKARPTAEKVEALSGPPGSVLANGTVDSTSILVGGHASVLPKEVGTKSHTTKVLI